MNPRVRFVLILMIAGAILCAIAAASIAQQQQFPPGCGPLTPLLEVLKQRYHQFRVLDLELTNGKLVIAVSPEGTWTILKVEGQDAACIFAAGKSSVVDRGI